MSKFVFLDRDGTIARDVNYCRRPEDFVLLPTVKKALSLLSRKGFKLVVITNQSGIARGIFSEAVLERIHAKMRSELKEVGVELDGIYYCPHHPDEKCACRKPGTALFKRAASELGIKLEGSYMVGDMELDVAAGKAVGCRTVLVTTGPKSPATTNPSPDFTAATLLEAAEWIVRREGGQTDSSG